MPTPLRLLRPRYRQIGSADAASRRGLLRMTRPRADRP